MLDQPLQLFELSGRSALVVGATGAFGSMASRALGALGVRLALAGASADKLDALATDLRARGAPVVTIGRRPEQAEDAEAMVDAAVAAHDGLDLVLVASGFNHVAPIQDMAVPDWDRVMSANVRGPWLVCRAAARALIARGRGGKIVLLSSTRGRLGHPAGYSAYCPSKGAIDLLTKTLACELGGHGICVNAIAPTVFRSDLTEWMYAEDGPGAQTRDAMVRRIPLGRLAEPEDFIGALVFLLSPASDFVTGQVVYVDGGYTAG